MSTSESESARTPTLTTRRRHPRERIPLTLSGSGALPLLANLVGENPSLQAAGPGAREAIAARIQLSAAQPLDQLAATSLEHAGSTFDPHESLRVAGGNQQLALALTERVGRAARLSLVTPVAAVRWSESWLSFLGWSWLDARRRQLAETSLPLTPLARHSGLAQGMLAMHLAVIAAVATVVAVPSGFASRLDLSGQYQPPRSCPGGWLSSCQRPARCCCPHLPGGSAGRF